MELPATGNSQIDAGHDRLLALLEKLRYNPPNLVQIIQELDERLAAHFEEEEALMKAAKYWGRKAHAAEHTALAVILTEAMPKEIWKAADYGEILRIVDCSRQSLVDHILGLDHKLALYLVRKELRAAAGLTKKPKKGPNAEPKKPAGA